MIRTLIVTTNGRLETDASLTRLNDPDIDRYWVDFNQPTEAEILQLETFFHFHPLAIEDSVKTLERPKLDYYDQFFFIATHAIEKGHLDKHEIDMFLGDNFIVTFHKKATTEINNVWQRIENTADREQRWDEYYIVYEILDKMVDNYFPLLYEIEDHLNKIDENTDEEPMQVLMEQLFDTRKDLLNIRQTINPMRDLLYRMLNSTHLPGVHERREYFADIHDHLLKLTDMIQSNREMTADIRDSHLSVNSFQQNRTMMVLTVITVIFSPLTFIAGVYGMNFQYMPELTWDYGYFIILGLMLIVGAGLFIWFRKKGWFD
ncbi:magnesium/cobalt transporter CorA [Tuberibacillus sp. Marseille-P3662]|uniref:magnesium/cobalt transporter CorA n=1 Tax=Tuberibacillus sp. Marseille-P3662 TaxID=1965358 RepID=UPI000A1C8E4E|nr:magnesium/cobalt transporter CorA [Tuberibacillus sp. Marseille-P3662]